MLISRQNLTHHTCLRILHEHLLRAIAAVAELLGVEAEEVEEGGVVVVMIDDVLHSVVAKVVGGAVDVAGLEAAAGDPHAEAVGVVVATHRGAVLGAGAVLNDGQSAHLATPVNDGGVEQAALFQIDDESGGALIDVGAGGRERGADVLMIVPGLIPGEKRDAAHPALDETTGDEAARAELGGGGIVDAVKLLGGGAFLIDVERFLGRRLHAGGEFKALDARFEIGFAGPGFEVLLVQTLHEIEVALLRIALEAEGRVEIRNARLFGTNDGALIQRRQPAVAPVVHTEHGQAARIGEGHVSGQVLIF